jgi:hypothetical protein
MTEYRDDLPDRPARIQRLPLSSKGYPVPFFVAYVDGEPDFRIADPAKLKRCVRENRCWLCGEPLGRYKAFVLGPMCTVNRIANEPPSHLDCATYAAQACPFLTRPHAHRRTANLTDDRSAPPGLAIMRNPGAVAVWITTSWELVRLQGGFLFQIGDPHGVHWYAEGVPASLAEVREGFESGVEILRAAADAQDPAARAYLDRQVAFARAYLPCERPAVDTSTRRTVDRIEPPPPPPEYS